MNYLLRKLLLIRHSNSRLTPGLAPDLWPLTDEGRVKCIALADKVGEYKLDVIYTSREPKAFETGQEIGKLLALEVHTQEGLHEHERPAFDTPSSQAEFTETVSNLMDHPDELVFGFETANQALLRYEKAVLSIVDDHSKGDIALVSHGTVMSLLVAKYNAVDVKSFWRGLQMPDLVVLSLPDFQLLG